MIDNWKVIQALHNFKSHFFVTIANATQSKEPMSMLKLVKNEKLRLPVFLCVILSIGRPMTGIGAMLFYSTNFFEMAGIDQESCQFATIGVGAIIFVMTLVTIPLMDKLGRRVLFLGGSIGQIICHIILTAALVLHSKQMEGKLEFYLDISLKNIYTFRDTSTFIL